MERATEILQKRKVCRWNILIFVTVGTHEQQFDRLVKKMDELALEIEEEIVIQKGYSLYKCKNIFQEYEMLTFQEMNSFVDSSEVIVTHGGPGSIFLPLSLGKKPIVVPRLKEFGEHVDNHQKDFAIRLKKEDKIDIVLEDIDVISELIKARLISKEMNYGSKKDNNNSNEIIKFLNEL